MILSGILGLTVAMSPWTVGATSPNSARSVPASSPVISLEYAGEATFDTIEASRLAHQVQMEGASGAAIEDVWHWALYLMRNIINLSRGLEYVKVTYQTTTASGEVIPVTGLAILPKAGLGDDQVPILALQHPTQIERKYSPSMFTATNMWGDNEFTVPFASLYALGGYAVLLADYPGMGVNTNVHPYCTESLANCVVDIIRAGRDLIKTNSVYAQWDGRVYLSGYSEGGYATLMSARDLQTRYTNEFTVSGVAGLDGPYSLSDTMRTIMMTADTGYTAPYFLPYVINGYDSVYRSLDSSFTFSNAVKYSVSGETNFATHLQQMVTAGTSTPAEVNTLMFKATPYIGPRSILTDTYLVSLSNSASLLCHILRSNDAYHAWTPRMPMRLYHNPNDDYVPFGNTTNAYKAFTASGATTVAQMAFGDKWYMADYWLIELLKTYVMSSYHSASAPFAYVYGFIWIDSLAYGLRAGPQNAAGDVDGDNTSDLIVYHETLGHWAALVSNKGRSYRAAATDESMPTLIQAFLGGPGCAPILKDFDGDGRADPCVYQAASGIWLFMLSQQNYASAMLSLGGPVYQAVPQDYNGDRRVEPAVYNRQTGQWIIYLPENNAYVTLQMSGSNGIPVRGDFDGDHRADPAVYDPGTGFWQITCASNGLLSSYTFGGADFVPVAADYDGEGKTDIAVYQESTGTWIVALPSGLTQGYCGGPGYSPVTGDFDGDGKADLLVYNESTGIWIGRFSASGYTPVSRSFGGPGYRPVP